MYIERLSAEETSRKTVFDGLIKVQPLVCFLTNDAIKNLEINVLIGLVFIGIYGLGNKKVMYIEYRAGRIC